MNGDYEFGPKYDEQALRAELARLREVVAKLREALGGLWDRAASGNGECRICGAGPRIPCDETACPVPAAGRALALTDAPKEPDNA